MKKMRTYLFPCLLMAAATAIIMTACQYKDFDEEPSETKKVPLTLHFDWQNVDSIPTKMQVMFYQGNSSGYQRFDVGNNDTTVMVLPGSYKISAWNNDASHVYFNGYNYLDSINATTPTFNPQNSQALKGLLDSLFPGHLVLDYPDYMVHANNRNVNIEWYDQRTVTLVPDSMVVTVDVDIHGIGGLEIVRSIRGAITNVAGKRYMAYHNRTTTPATVLFEARGNAADSTVTGRFWVFGLRPEEIPKGEHEAALFFWTTNGNVFINWDITDLVNKADKNDMILKLEVKDMGIDIRDIVPEQGLNIDIEGWNNEVKPIGF